jgi:inosine/xanthosine triphosphate pyrophosphatase family protein
MSLPPSVGGALTLLLATANRGKLAELTALLAPFALELPQPRGAAGDRAAV